MRGYVIIRTKLPVAQYLYELVRCSDGAVIAQSTTHNPIVSPEWMRQQQARLNTKVVMDEIAQ